jgi:glutamyl-tRNA reductase
MRTAALSRAALDAVMKRRYVLLLLILDAGLPRNVEPGSAAEILNIDAIRERQEGALAQRRAAIPEVERIVSEELAVWEQWRALRPVEGMLKTLFQNASDTSRDLAREFSASTASDAESLERLVHSRVRGLLRNHARSLRCFFETPVPAEAQP